MKDMNDLENLEQELTANLAAAVSAAEKPCGCHEKSENPFGDVEGAAAGSNDLLAELELAVSGLGAEFADSSQQLTAEEAFEFASVAGDSGTSLEDIVALVEQYPGLKITFSR